MRNHPDDQIEHLFVVGAGFSYHAGLPLASNFTEELLDLTKLKALGPSSLTVRLVTKFVGQTFDHGTAAKFWPHLEDIFTCIDLSANTGHHLGPTYSPSYLRTVRRALIVRIIRMLSIAYTKGKKQAGPHWKILERFLSIVEPQRCAFLSMNWDTVIEEGLKRTQGVSVRDYGCNAKYAEFANSRIQLPAESLEPSIQVLKPHGSINWLYCDACRQVFYFPAGSRSSQKIADQLFRNSDWNILRELTGKTYKTPGPTLKCPVCKASALGTRLATFSYRKALDFPMHEDSWRSAERLLRQARTWIFVGYSMPAADYEFKHLLKRVQLSRVAAPKLVLITGGGDADRTRQNYQKFFGRKISSSSPAFFKHGLNTDAITYLKKLGALRHPSVR